MAISLAYQRGTLYPYAMARKRLIVGLRERRERKGLCYMQMRRSSIRNETQNSFFMATLGELCTKVPIHVQRVMEERTRLMVERELLRRKAASYSKRMNALREEQNIFDKCKGVRTRKRFRNYICNEQAGRIGMRIKEVRTPSGRVIVCKTPDIYKPL